MTTGAARSAGRVWTSSESASMPPAEEPTTMRCENGSASDNSFPLSLAWVLGMRLLWPFPRTPQQLPHNSMRSRHEVLHVWPEESFDTWTPSLILRIATGHRDAPETARGEGVLRGRRPGKDRVERTRHGCHRCLFGRSRSPDETGERPALGSAGGFIRGPPLSGRGP